MFNNDEFQFPLEHEVPVAPTPLDGEASESTVSPGPPSMATEETPPSSPTSTQSFPFPPPPPAIDRRGGGTVIGEGLFAKYTEGNDHADDVSCFTDDTSCSDLSSFDTQSFSAASSATMVADRGEAVFKKIASLGLQITSFVKSKDKSPLQILAFIDTLMHHLEVSDAAYDFCYAQFKKLMKIGSSKITPQSLGEAVKADVIKYVKDHLNFIVKKMIGYVSAIMVAPSCLNSSDAFTRMVGIALKSQSFTAINCTSAVVDAIANGLSSVARYLVGCTFPDAVSELIVRSVNVRDTFERNKDMFDAGMKSDFDELCCRLKGQLHVAHAKYMSEEKMTIASAVLTEYKLLTALHTKLLRISVTCKASAAPLSLFILGDPAIGKSEALNMIMSMTGHLHNGCPYSESQIAPMVRSKFYDTVTNETKVIVIDDVGATVKQGESSDAITENFARLLIDIVNNVTFRANKAIAEDKGQVAVEVQAVFATGNWASRNADIKSCETPSAALRRHDRVVLTLRDEYKTAHGKIDLQKIAAEGGNMFVINPWFICYYKYDFMRARELTNANNGAKEIIYEELWKPIEFARDGELVKSVDMSTTDLYQLLKEQIQTGKGDSAAVANIRKATSAHLATLDSIEPQSFISGFAYGYGIFFVFNLFIMLLTWILNFFIKTRPFILDRYITNVQGLHGSYDYLDNYVLLPEIYQEIVSRSVTLFTCIQTTWYVANWCVFETILALVRHSRRTGGTTTVYDTLGAVARFSSTLFFQIWVHYFMVGIVANSPRMAGWCKYFRVTGHVMAAVSRRTTTVDTRTPEVLCRDMVVRPNYERSFLHGLISLVANRQELVKLSKCIVGGILSGLTLGMVIRFVRYMKNTAEIARLVTPESTLSAEGIITAVSDIEIEAPKKATKVTKGRADWQSKGSSDTAVKTMTHGQCQNMVVANMVRVRVTPSDSALMADMSPTDVNSVSFGISYNTSAKGVSILTVAHTFQHYSKYYKIEIFMNEEQKVRPFIITRDHICFMNDVKEIETNGDLCMFMAKGTGDMKNLECLFDDEKRATGDSCTRLVPSQVSDLYSHRDCITLVPTVFRSVQNYNYISGTPASDMLQNCMGCYFDGQGAGGLCGTVIMRGGVPIAMHTGEDKGAQRVIGVPLIKSWIDMMYYHIIDKMGGNCSAVPTMVPFTISAPHMDASYSDIAITPNVYIRPDSAIDVAYGQAQHSFIGSVLKGGQFTGVKVNSSLKQSPFIDKIVEHLPICAGIRETFSPPTEEMYKTHDTMIENTCKPKDTEHYTLKAAKDCIANVFNDAAGKALAAHEPFNKLAPRNFHATLQGLKTNMANKLALDTSMGPLGGGTKNQHFGTGYNPETDEMEIGCRMDSVIGMDIQRQFDEVIRRRASGEVGISLYNVVPKDEALPVKGYREDGSKYTKTTRSITVQDVVHTLVVRSYFTPLLALYGFDSLECGHSVGLDPTVTYTAMLKKLIGSDNISGLDKVNFIAMDFSKFDLNLSQDLVAAVMDIILSTTYLLPGYRAEDRMVMSSIAYDLVNPTMNMGGTLMRFSGTNASGNPLTTMINCVANQIINCQIRLMCEHDIKSGMHGKVGPRDYSDVTVEDCTFSEVTRFTTYGDDNILCNPIDDPIDQLVTIEYGAMLGLTITGSDKAVNAEKHAQGFAFLKRSIVAYSDKDSGRIVVVLAPLDITSIFKPFVWGAFKEDLMDQYAGTIKGTIGELVQHGQEVYDEYVTKLKALIIVMDETRKPRKKAAVIERRLSAYFNDSHFPTWHDAMLVKYGDLLDDGVGGFIDPRTLLVTRL